MSIKLLFVSFLNESTIEVGKTQKGLHILDPGGDFLLSNRSDFLLVHSETIRWNDIPKEFNRASIKLTLLGFYVKSMFLKFGQDKSDVLGVLYVVLWEDKYVIEIDDHKLV